MNFFSPKKTLPLSISVPKPLKFVIKFIQFFSHKLTVLITTTLFTTPIIFKTPKREIPMRNSSQKKRLHVENISKEVEILSYGYSKKKVLLAHGWSGRSTQLFMFANKLLENGYMIISFDGPSHGNSSGKKTNMIEFIETIKSINKEFGPFETAIGHSFGGMGLFNVLAEEEIFKCLVTIGAGDKVSDILSNFTKNLGLKDIISKKMETYFHKKWGIKVDNFASSKAAENIKVPTLIIHDTIDGDVNVSCALNIRQNLKNGELYITNGLGHSKILYNKKVALKVVNFIKQNS